MTSGVLTIGTPICNCSLAWLCALQLAGANAYMLLFVATVCKVCVAVSKCTYMSGHAQCIVLATLNDVSAPT